MLPAKHGLCITSYVGSFVVSVRALRVSHQSDFSHISMKSKILTSGFEEWFDVPFSQIITL